MWYNGWFFTTGGGKDRNAVYGIGLTDDVGCKRVGTSGVSKLVAASTAYNDVCLGTIASRPSSISNSSEKVEKEMTKMHWFITVVNEIPPKA